MKKYFASALITVFALGFSCSNAIAQSLPSSKAVAAAGQMQVVPVSGDTDNGDTKADSGWQDIMTKTIKVSMNKDLFVDVSLETGLITNTLVASKLLGKSTSIATAGIDVQVVLNKGTPKEKIVAPGAVTFDRRKQSLIAQFGGYIAPECLVVTIDPVTGAVTGVTIDETCVQPEKLELLLDTMAAHSFNFIAADVPTGTHKITVQAKLSYDVYHNYIPKPGDPVGYYTGKAAATALLRLGSMTIESVRMIMGTDIVEF